MVGHFSFSYATNKAQGELIARVKYYQLDIIFPPFSHDQRYVAESHKNYFGVIKLFL